CATITPDEAR
nr:NADP-specific isocitrate dehydrogenase peptide I [swine, heart, Peptide Partial, 10 aa] [Sus scrofa]